MSGFREVAGWVAGAISASAFIPYLRSVVRKQTTPSTASWLIWTLVGALLCSSYWASGARAAIWVSVSYMVGPLITLGFCVRYGDRSWSRLDIGCVVLALVSIVLWTVTGVAWVALALNIGIDFFGAVPTIRKSWSEPGSEDKTAWGLFFLGNTVNLLAIETWTPAMYLYPAYLFAVTLVVNTLLWRARIALVAR
ncbi:MAG: hypothetical protein U0165_02740 [Polyangiaceae bacterium]